MIDSFPFPALVPAYEIIEDVLYELGITPQYIGFSYSSYAVYLVAQQPERLLLITKWLYPDVAKHYHTTWYNVERGIRTVAAVAWKFRPDKLTDIANYDLTRRPTNTQFIAMLAKHIQITQSANLMDDSITPKP